MLGISDVRDIISGIGVASNDHVYCGKLDDKVDKSIGVYHLNRNGKQPVAVGGIENSSYAIKSVSILVHWNKSVRDTEKAAQELYEKLRDLNNVTVNGTVIKFTDMKVPEPVDVGTDDKGIFEMVIELDIYYER